jgi:hypothetical protein
MEVLHFFRSGKTDSAKRERKKDKKKKGRKNIGTETR